MPRASRIIIATLATALVAGTAVAQDANPAIAARKAHMDLYAFNLGLVGGMARGNIEYDADAASAAAANIAALSKIDQSRYWPEGTSTAARCRSTGHAPAPVERPRSRARGAT